MNSKLIAEFCIPGSIAIQMKSEILNSKLELLESAGYDYGKNGKIDNLIVEKINHPLLNKDEYFKLAKLYEDWCRKKLNNHSNSKVMKNN